MRYYIGLDVHGKNTVIGVINQEGQRLYKKRVANYISLILSELEPFRSETAGVVVESTFNWYWLVDSLLEAGYQVHLAHPAANHQYSGLKHTDDFHDAFHLAQLLRLGILAEGYIYPKKERAIRDLLRKRSHLVRQRTSNILSFKSLYNNHTGKSLSLNQLYKLKDTHLQDILQEPHVFLSAQVSLSCIEFLTHHIRQIEKVVLHFMKPTPEFTNLLSIPGVGPILALTIALETGDIRRFPSVGNYVSYCRCVSSQRISNDKKKGQNNRKNGNKYLAWAFLEAANFALRHSPAAKRFYQRKLASTNKTVALKALAHKLARAAFFILRDRVKFDENKLFGSLGCGSQPASGLA